jgi:hypothetical protein
MHEAIVLTVSPVGYSTRGRLFDATVDGRMIVSRSLQPLLDGARALLAEGAEPMTRLATRHAGSNYDALRSTVGKAAGMAVADAGKPVFKRWQPYDRAKTLP